MHVFCEFEMSANERTVTVVQKYGGTLLRDRSDRRQVVETIRETQARGRQVVVVVSAMGRGGDPYATDTLIELARQFAGQPEPRALDLLLTAGETISASLLAMELSAAGVPAIPYSGMAAGVVTTDEFGQAGIVRVDARRLQEACQAGRVPVVAGFQGATEGLEATTLGRGGSDLTAVALGAAMGADAVEIVKDVRGVMTADPAVVPDARLVPAISYEDLLLLTAMGSRVVQQEAVELAARHRVRLVVRRLGAADGTRVLHTRTTAPVVTYRDDVMLLRLHRRPGDTGLSGANDLLTAADGERLYLTRDRRTLTACVRRTALPRLKALLARLPNAEVRQPCSVVTMAGLDERRATQVLVDGRARLRAAGIPILHAHNWGLGAAFVVEPAQVQHALAHLNGLG
jgi:aspartate kinase